MWNILECFMCCFIFAFMFFIMFHFIEAKLDIATANHWQITIGKTSSCKCICQHAGKHLLGRNKTFTEWEATASCGTLCLYISGICGILWNVLCVFVLCFKYRNAGGPVRTTRPGHCGSIHMVIAYSP